MTLEERLDRVRDRASFLEFVDSLAEDREDEVKKERLSPSPPFGPGTNGWENGSIETYLDACVRCAVDGDALPEEPSWQAFAHFLWLGKGYE